MLRERLHTFLVVKLGFSVKETLDELSLFLPISKSVKLFY